MPYHRSARGGKELPSGRTQVQTGVNQTSLDEPYSICEIPPQYVPAKNVEKDEIDEFYQQFPLDELEKVSDYFRSFLMKLDKKGPYYSYFLARSGSAYNFMYRLRLKKKEEAELQKKEPTIPEAEPTEDMDTAKATKPALNPDNCEEASASESEPQTDKPKEPSTKMRKRKKNKKPTDVDSTKPTISNTDSSTPLVNPTPPPMETSEESHIKESEPSTTASKALPAKKLKILIRGLPLDFNKDSIFLELGKHNLDILKVVQFRKREGGAYRPLPLFLIVLPEKDNFMKIYHIVFIKDFPISVEKFRGGRGPLQCFKCQRFGHSQRTCTSEPRCMKCAEGHFSYQCKKSRDSPATCCNCSKEHTSNFPGCEARPSRKRRQISDKPAATAHRLVSIVKELQEILKNEVVSLLQTIILGSAPTK